ncbi:MAG: agmatinase [Chloroflexi bacterium]|nr:agmatinase [Chloroflexota bacterium]
MRRHTGANGGDIVRSGSPTFFGVPLAGDLRQIKADVAFLGIPFDMGTNDRPGSRFGPRLIRDASMRFAGIGRDGWYDIEENRHILQGVRMVDGGDVNIRTVDFFTNFQKITEAVAALRATGALPVQVGGDHACTYPIVRAFTGRPLQVVQFDAHLDYTDEWQGQRYSHDNQMRRISELPGVGLICHVGIRSLFERVEPVEAARGRGNVIIPSKTIVEQGAHTAIERLPLTDAPCYVTIDIDVLSPSIAPGTGFPEPGGISYYHLKEALITLARRTTIVGFDVVEVAPWFDSPAAVTPRVAARLMLDFLGAIFERRE